MYIKYLNFCNNSIFYIFDFCYDANVINSCIQRKTNDLRWRIDRAQIIIDTLIARQAANWPR